jgi:hypothetical protein
MTSTANEGPFVLAVSDTLSDIIRNRLPEIWQRGDRKLFEHGINSISVSVKVGLVEVAVSVAGPDKA